MEGEKVPGLVGLSEEEAQRRTQIFNDLRAVRQHTARVVFL